MIKGEISNFTRHAKSGHFYFTLKDSEAAVKAVMWNSYADDLGFLPENGMNVIVTASVSVYERDGQYQLYCNDIVPDGLGKLFTAYEQLKTRLADEGLFDESRKKPLPSYPMSVGVITAKGAAALSDMITIIKRRAPYVKITLYETMVQGVNAAADIAKTITLADTNNEDILIVGRGGGSFEDLFAFSDEKVVRAVAEAKTPIISAVGHETDNPLCDLSADLRAPTPSAAAELAVPDTSAIIEKLYSKLSKIRSLMPTVTIERSYSALYDRRRRIIESVNRLITSYEHKLTYRAGAIEKLSPIKVLARGFALVERDSSVISRAEQLTAGDKVTIRFTDGVITARID
jgi:exodeoxyribonuclease VII large subunit